MQSKSVDLSLIRSSLDAAAAADCSLLKP